MNRMAAILVAIEAEDWDEMHRLADEHKMLDSMHNAVARRRMTTYTANNIRSNIINTSSQRQFTKHARHYS